MLVCHACRYAINLKFKQKTSTRVACSVTPVSASEKQKKKVKY